MAIMFVNWEFYNDELDFFKIPIGLKNAQM